MIEAILAAVRFFLSPIGRLIGVALISAAIAGTGAWRTANKLSDARWYKAQAAAKDDKILQLEARIKAANDAAHNDQTRASVAEASRAQAEKLANDLKSQIPDGDGFTGDDTDRLRQLWGAAPAQGRRH